MLQKIKDGSINNPTNTNPNNPTIFPITFMTTNLQNYLVIKNYNLKSVIFRFVYIKLCPQKII